MQNMDKSTDKNTNINQQNSGKAGGTMSGGGEVGKNLSGNPDVSFGSDESGSGDVEINTGGLGDSKEIDLDRTGPKEEAAPDSSDKSFSMSDEDLGESRLDEEDSGTYFDSARNAGRFGNEHSSSI